jgi:hypothetical protein
MHEQPRNGGVSFRHYQPRAERFDPCAIPPAQPLDAVALERRLHASTLDLRSVESVLALTLTAFGKRSIDALTDEQRGYVGAWIARVEQRGMRALPVSLRTISRAISKWAASGEQQEGGSHGAE